MSELKQRVITAFFLVIGAIYWMFYTSGELFNTITAIVGLLAVYELLVMLSLPFMWGYLAVLAVPVLLWVLDQVQIPLVLLVLMPVVLWQILYVFSHRLKNNAESFSRFAYAQSMTILLMLFSYALIELHQTKEGVLFLSGAMLGVWTADIAAYFVGKAIGKNKLCPSISPGKSVEGFFGGLIFGVLVAVFFWVSYVGLELLFALILAIVLIIISVVGDLSESALKRSVGVKDSGKMLPGHGGILDRIDALLPSIPLVSALWMVLK